MVHNAFCFWDNKKSQRRSITSGYSFLLLQGLWLQREHKALPTSHQAHLTCHQVLWHKCLNYLYLLKSNAPSNQMQPYSISLQPNGKLFKKVTWSRESSAGSLVSALFQNCGNLVQVPESCFTLRGKDKFDHILACLRENMKDVVDLWKQ